MISAVPNGCAVIQVAEWTQFWMLANVFSSSWTRAERGQDEVSIQCIQIDIWGPVLSGAVDNLWFCRMQLIKQHTIGCVIENVQVWHNECCQITTDKEHLTQRRMVHVWCTEWASAHILVSLGTGFYHATVCWIQVKNRFLWCSAIQWVVNMLK